MADGKFPADEINDQALERLFATRLKTGEEKEIFEVSEHNLEEARSWLKFTIGRQTWTADTQGKEWLLENCQGQPTGTVQIFTRDHFATRSRKPDGGGKPKTALDGGAEGTEESFEGEDAARFLLPSLPSRLSQPIRSRVKLA